MSAEASRPRLLVVGGTGGFVGRAVLSEFGPTWTVRSLHRRPAANERPPHVEWVPGDAATTEWDRVLEGVDVVLNLAWYRFGPERLFAPLADGLLRLVHAAEARGVARFLQVSVPDAPYELETSLPYLVHKRRVDRALEASGLSYAIVRPTMLFGPHDKLATVMMRTMHRYRRFPMFGDGRFHLSPIAARDLAGVLGREATSRERHTVSVGGPERWEYRALTDAMFQSLGLAPRYFRLSPRGAYRLARFLETFGSTLLYAYEVTWLLSDRLGLPAYEGLDRPLAPIGPFLAEESARLRGEAPPPSG